MSGHHDDESFAEDPAPTEADIAALPAIQAAVDDAYDPATDSTPEDVLRGLYGDDLKVVH